ncbi:hypothetical protein FQR65_LT03691 [Abscondita terminalis]|nr:hypothetical protein FQR65_LT03691 [Abscondita terminalis]
MGKKKPAKGSGDAQQKPSSGQQQQQQQPPSVVPQPDRDGAGPSSRGKGRGQEVGKGRGQAQAGRGQVVQPEQQMFSQPPLQPLQFPISQQQFQPHQIPAQQLQHPHQLTPQQLQQLLQQQQLLLQQMQQLSLQQPPPLQQQQQLSSQQIQHQQQQPHVKHQQENINQPQSKPVVEPIVVPTSEISQQSAEVSSAPGQPKQEGKKRRGQKKETKPQTPATPSIATVGPSQQKSETPASSQKSSVLDIIVPQRQKLNSGGTKGRKILIETNHLALQFKNLGIAFHYDVSIDPDKPKKLMRTVMEQFRRQYYPNRYPAFDGVKNLYSSSMLPFGQEISGEVTIQEDDRDKVYKVKMKIASQIDLNVLSQYFEAASRGNRHMVTPQEAIQCIDVVLRNAPSLRCVPVGRSFFTKPQDRLLDLGEGMEMYYGFYQSAILGWKPFLNVDVSHKAFPKVMPVLDMIREICDRYYDIKTPLERQNFEAVDKFIRNLKVTYQIPNQPATRRVMRVNGLDEPASKAKFKNEQNVEMTVEFYFQRVKNVRLNYPHLPCLWVGSKQRQPKILVPAEFCTIVEGQVTNRAMTPGQTSSMIKIAATSTTDRKQKIMQGIRTANYSTDPCAREFNISVNQDFAKIQARILEPPSLQYSNRQVIPRAGVWRADKFSSPGSYRTGMIREGQILGMKVDAPEIVGPIRLQRGKEKLKLEEEFRKLKAKSLILVIIPDFVKEVYNYVKQAAELSVGVVTQCVKAKNVFRIKPTTVSNILLKVNAKLNGRNHQLTKTPACLTRPCMIMGADVTHPSPESRGSVPSVAAVTASHDMFAFQYNITWRLQPSTQEIITDLANIVREHLMFFYRKNKSKPERIIFFRDGVSEGQFEVVVQSEVQAVRNACKMLSPSGDYKPKITFLVVQKRHHTRFFPTNPRDSEDRNFNVPAGTVVDTDITHPTALDFYLVSHASIQGVARPTKYRKLWDDHDMQEDELEELTYHLCHLFTRCNRSVSYPAPTYYAHLAAARAKVYCEGKRINLSNLDREQEQLQIKPEITEGKQRDPAPLFFNNEVQLLLKALTRVDLNKVYKTRRSGDVKLEVPTYKFMTDEQLQESLEEAKERVNDLLQMPPVVQVRDSIDHVYVNDSALKGLESNKVIFTDVTFGIKDRDRLIVVREPDGILRDANWNERDRMNQVYFPKVNRKLKVPKMFQEEFLQDLLKRKEYEFILNRACVQFEPDHPEYHRVTSVTYQHINENNGFDVLRSTRHFGPLAFYLTWYKNIDNLLLELIETAHIEEVNHLLHLYGKINDVEFNVSDVYSLDALSEYIKNMANKKGSLELAVQAYKDLVKQRKKLEEGIEIAHGRI